MDTVTLMNAIRSSSVKQTKNISDRHEDWQLAEEQ